MILSKLEQLLTVVKYPRTFTFVQMRITLLLVNQCALKIYQKHSMLNELGGKKQIDTMPSPIVVHFSLFQTLLVILLKDPRRFSVTQQKTSLEALDYFSFKYFSEGRILVFCTTESHCREIEFVAGKSQNTQKLGNTRRKTKRKKHVT